LGKGFIIDQSADHNIFAETDIDRNEYDDHCRYNLVKDEEMNDARLCHTINYLLEKKEAESND